MKLWNGLSDQGRVQYGWYALRLAGVVVLWTFGVGCVLWKLAHAQPMLEGLKWLAALLGLGVLLMPPSDFMLLVRETIRQAMKPRP